MLAFRQCEFSSGCANTRHCSKGKSCAHAVPSQWLSDDGGALSGLKTNQENKLVLHWRVNARLTSASTQLSPSESKTGAEEPNTASRIPQACSTSVQTLLAGYMHSTDYFVPSQGVLHPLMISKKKQSKDLVQVEPWPDPPTGTRPHTPGPEFCLWTPNRQQHMRDEGLS